MAAYVPDSSPRMCRYLFTQWPHRKPGGEMLVAGRGWGVYGRASDVAFTSGSMQIGRGIASGVDIVWWWTGGVCRVV
jgi:hypothetical protein